MVMGFGDSEGPSLKAAVRAERQAVSSSVSAVAGVAMERQAVRPASARLRRRQPPDRRIPRA